jgi:hypothetical protein
VLLQEPVARDVVGVAVRVQDCRWGERRAAEILDNQSRIEAGIHDDAVAASGQVGDVGILGKEFRDDDFELERGDRHE